MTQANTGYIRLVKRTGAAVGRAAYVTGKMVCNSVTHCGTVTGSLARTSLGTGSSWVSVSGKASAKTTTGNQGTVPTAWIFTLTMDNVLFSAQPRGIALEIRCDNNVVASMGKGCVFPSVKPILALSKSGTASGVAVHVGKALATGLPSTLNRATPAEAVKNRAKACPSSLTRDVGYQCDEYPFASSKQGAASGGSARVPSGCRWAAVAGSGAIGWSRCQVKSEQNAAGGTQLNKLYLDNRVLPGDQYMVRVVA